MPITETVKTARMDLPQEGYDAWVDFTTTTQRREDGTLVLLHVKWQQRSSHVEKNGHRCQLRGASGETYWFPDGAVGSLPGRVYSRGTPDGGFNSYGDEFETSERFTAMDLVNLASFSYDTMHWPHLVTRDAGDPGDTNPFRPYVFEAVAA